MAWRSDALGGRRAVSWHGCRIMHEVNSQASVALGSRHNQPDGTPLQEEVQPCIENSSETQMNQSARMQGYLKKLASNNKLQLRWFVLSGSLLSYGWHAGWIRQQHKTIRLQDVCAIGLNDNNICLELNDSRKIRLVASSKDEAIEWALQLHSNKRVLRQDASIEYPTSVCVAVWVENNSIIQHFASLNDNEMPSTLTTRPDSTLMIDTLQGYTEETTTCRSVVRRSADCVLTTYLDGSTLETRKDGTTVTKSLGRTVETRPDGTIITLTPGSDVVRATSLPGGAVVEVYSNGTVVETHNDTTTTHPNGTVVRVAKDNTTTQTDPDGTTTTTEVSGRRVVLYPSGASLETIKDWSCLTNPDGTITTTTPLRVVTQHPDGRVVDTDKATLTIIEKNTDNSSTETRKDGTTIYTSPDNSSIETRTNGTTIRRAADGSSIQVDADGTTTTTTSNGAYRVLYTSGEYVDVANGYSVTTKLDKTIITTTIATGFSVTNTPDGRVIKRSKDGTTVETRLDGTSTTTHPNGTTVETLSNNSTVETRRDGTVVVCRGGTTFEKRRDGTTIETRRDGSSTKKTPDGITLETKTDGSTLQTRPGGRTLETKPDGSTLQTNPDGSTLRTKTDGSTLQTKPDGTTLETLKTLTDSKTIERDRRGVIVKTVQTRQNGDVVEWREGITITSRRDGSSVTVYSKRNISTQDVCTFVDSRHMQTAARYLEYDYVVRIETCAKGSKRFVFESGRTRWKDNNGYFGHNATENRPDGSSSKYVDGSEVFRALKDGTRLIYESSNGKLIRRSESEARSYNKKAYKPCQVPLSSDDFENLCRYLTVGNSNDKLMDILTKYKLTPQDIPYVAGTTRSSESYYESVRRSCSSCRT